MQVFVNVSPDFRHFNRWVPPHHWLPIWSHKELFKVPFDVADPHGLPKQPVHIVAKVSSYWRAGILCMTSETTQK